MIILYASSSAVSCPSSNLEGLVYFYYFYLNSFCLVFLGLVQLLPDLAILRKLVMTECRLAYINKVVFREQVQVLCWIRCLAVGQVVTFTVPQYPLPRYVPKFSRTILMIFKCIWCLLFLSGRDESEDINMREMSLNDHVC